MRKKYVPPKNKIELLMLNHIPKPPARHIYPQYRGFMNSRKRCHHCGKYGHINPFAIVLLVILSFIISPCQKGRKLKNRRCESPKKLSHV